MGRHISRRVRRWRGGEVIPRSVGAGVAEAAQGVRRLEGYRDTAAFVAAVRRDDGKTRRSNREVDVQENAA